MLISLSCSHNEYLGLGCRRLELLSHSCAFSRLTIVLILWLDWGQTMCCAFMLGMTLLCCLGVTTPNPSTVAASSPKETSPLSIAQEEQPIEEAREEQPADDPIKGDPGPIRKSGRVKRPPTWIRDFFLE